MKMNIECRCAISCTRSLPVHIALASYVARSSPNQQRCHRWVLYSVPVDLVRSIHVTVVVSTGTCIQVTCRSILLVTDLCDRR